ncbi:hypothetical protein ACVGWC_20250, partial [Enterobacter hormaechei]
FIERDVADCTFRHRGCADYLQRFCPEIFFPPAVVHVIFCHQVVRFLAIGQTLLKGIDYLPGFSSGRFTPA